MQEETGDYDIETRYYDPIILRTTTLDPHAENYYDLSPYSWVGNNPIINIDPTGMDWYQHSESGAVMWREGNDKSVTHNDQTYKNIGKSYTLQSGNTSYTFNQNTLSSMEETVLDKGDFKTQMSNGEVAVQCFDAALGMAQESGAKPLGGIKNGIQTSKESKLKNGEHTVNATLDAQKGINYLDSQIDDGHSVVLGVDYVHGTDINDKTTDHFVTVSSLLG